MVKTPSFKWQPGDPPPIIEPHSEAKLKVLHEYLIRYVETMAANIKIETLRFDVVDGFAGGGLFEKSDGSLINGSPITFIETIEAARISVGEKRGRPLNVDINYYFIDHDPGAIEYLKNTLLDRGHGDKLNRSVYLICDQWVNVYQSVVSAILSRRKSGRAILFLDQCGYTDVPLNTIRLVLAKLKKAEIILNFATDFLANYYTVDDRFRSALQKAGIDEKILRDPVIASKDKGWRFALEREISRDIRAVTESHYSTPFYIVSEISNNAYWLVHLCSHPKANDEMLKTHWSIGNHFRHYGGPGTDMHMWGYSAKNDPELHNILDLGFEEIDRQKCVEALNEQLPRIIFENPDGLTFSALRERLKNNTLVWEDEIRERLINIQKETNDLEIITPVKNIRRSSQGISADDIIRKPSQGIFDFGKNKS